MAAHPKFDKMAVTVDNSSSNTSVYDTNSKEDLDHRPLMGGMKSLTDGMHKKKSTFKITSVTKNIQRPPIGGDPPNDADGDSMDDLDETVESHTEELSSEILDSSKYTDLGDQDTPLEDFTQTFGQDSEVIISNTTGKEVINKEKSDVHSSTTTRFKVVKIETKEPFRRGRWLCHDLLDTPITEKSETKVVRDSTDDQANSGNSSASSSIHYVPGVDDPAKNPLSVTGLQIQGTDGYVIQGDNQSDKFQSKQQPGMVPSSQDSTHSYNQPNPNVSQVPTSLPTHPSQNYQGIIVSAGVGSPGQTRQGLSQTGQVSGHGGSIPPGHVQKPMQVQTPVVDNTNPSSQHSTMPVTVSSGTSQISNSITGQMPPALNDQTKLPPQGGTGPVPSAQTQINQSTLDSSSSPASNKDNAHWNESDVGEGNSLNFNIAASQSYIDQTGLDSRLTHQLKPVTVPANLSDFSAPILTPLAVAEAVGGMSSPTKADESGSSTVAIDNKIEQAMDLVKSHLMYAVREEVEVLKEQIQELVEKNNQLEYENSILRASASQETLSKIQAPRQSQPPSSST